MTSQIVGQAIVAPYVGAWIETGNVKHLASIRDVAPYVGAWIETFFEGYYFPTLSSHPMWVRGLKQRSSL